MGAAVQITVCTAIIANKKYYDVTAAQLRRAPDTGASVNQFLGRADAHGFRSCRLRLRTHALSRNQPDSAFTLDAMNFGDSALNEPAGCAP